MEWSERQILQLRELWGIEGLSSAEIGRRMGASKNAVVGKAHRLGLPSRPSPIKPRTDGQPANPPGRRQGPHPIKGDTLPPLGSVVDGETVTAKGGGGKPRKPKPGRARPKPQIRPVTSQPPPQQRAPGNGPPCCWPMGDTRSRVFRFCDEPSTGLGKPYCHEHAKLAYRPLSDRRRQQQDAAA